MFANWDIINKHNFDIEWYSYKTIKIVKKKMFERKRKFSYLDIHIINISFTCQYLALYYILLKICIKLSINSTVFIDNGKVTVILNNPNQWEPLIIGLRKCYL